MDELPAKDAKFFDGVGKAFIFGAIYYFNRRVGKLLKKKSLPMPDRYALLVKATDTVIEAKEWNHFSKAAVHGAVYSMAGYFTIDEAFGTTFTAILREYEQELEKAGLPK